jgi:DNA repair protein RadC
MRYYKKEHFQVLLIDAKGRIIEEAEVSIGDLCSTVIHPREVFSQAIRRGAASVLFVHNHPSGDPQPSQEDVETTERLVKAASILGIYVLDHIIIGDGRYVSMKGKGLM